MPFTNVLHSKFAATLRMNWERGDNWKVWRGNGTWEEIVLTMYRALRSRRFGGEIHIYKEKNYRLCHRPRRVVTLPGRRRKYTGCGYGFPRRTWMSVHLINKRTRRDFRRQEQQPKGSGKPESFRYKQLELPRFFSRGPFEIPSTSQALCAVYLVISPSVRYVSFYPTLQRTSG